jgi:hypothetical protein
MQSHLCLLKNYYLIYSSGTLKAHGGKNAKSLATLELVLYLFVSPFNLLLLLLRHH